MFFSLFSLMACANSGADFIRISEYLQLHPEQVMRMSSFAERVRRPAAPMPIPPPKAVRIAVIYPGVQNSDYWQKSIYVLEQRLQELQIPFTLKTYLSRPTVDLELQGEQLIEALAWQPDYLIFSADALHHKTMIQRILLNGYPKLILQNITTPLRAWQLKRPLLYTGFDHELGTQMLASEMLRTSSATPYALLYFSPGYISRMRGDTFAEMAAQRPAAPLKARFYTDGNRVKARKAVEKLLARGEEINMIYACSTDIALGAADALSAAGLHEAITLNGWGGGDAELAALQKGEIDLTVLRMNDDASVAIAEAIHLDLMGKSNQIPHVYSGDMVLLNKTMKADELRQHTERAFRYSHASAVSGAAQ